MKAVYPNLENANAAAELSALPNVNVCPECEGDGATPYSMTYDPNGCCTLCHGRGVVTDERLQLWVRNYQSQVLYHSGHMP
jgi:DnaJ-class molecular chaperone